MLTRAYVGPRQALLLVRVGRRILVVGATPTGISRVAELTDPEEVEQVAARCQRGRAGSISNTFRSLLTGGLAAFRPPGGAAEDAPADGPEPDARPADGAPTPPADPAEAGLVRQELDLILGKVRSWREQQEEKNGPPTGATP